MLVAIAAGLAMSDIPVHSAQEKRMTLSITSTAYAADGAIPALYTCEGRDLSPPLAWTGVPAAAKSLVLIVDDPDAPDPAAPKMTWVHWIVYISRRLREVETRAWDPAGSRAPACRQ